MRRGREEKERGPRIGSLSLLFSPTFSSPSTATSSLLPALPILMFCFYLLHVASWPPSFPDMTSYVHCGLFPLPPKFSPALTSCIFV